MEVAQHTVEGAPRGKGVAEEGEWDCHVCPIGNGGMPLLPPPSPPPPQMPPPLCTDEKQCQTVAMTVDLPTRTPCHPDGCHRSLPLGIGCCSNIKTPA